jgi:hypothetical protein
VAGGAGAAGVVELGAGGGAGFVEQGEAEAVGLAAEPAAGAGQVGLQRQVAVDAPFLGVEGGGGQFVHGAAELGDERVGVGPDQFGQQPGEQPVEVGVERHGGVAQGEADAAQLRERDLPGGDGVGQGGQPATQAAQPQQQPPVETGVAGHDAEPVVERHAGGLLDLHRSPPAA